VVTIITLKQQKFSQSDPVLISQFSQELQSGQNWLQSWSSPINDIITRYKFIGPIQSWSVLMSATEALEG